MQPWHRCMSRFNDERKSALRGAFLMQNFIALRCTSMVRMCVRSVTLWCSGCRLVQVEAGRFMGGVEHEISIKTDSFSAISIGGYQEW